jgi:hypothetical protein
MFFKVITSRKLREARSTAEIQAEAERVHAAHPLKPVAPPPSEDGGHDAAGVPQGGAA